MDGRLGVDSEHGLGSAFWFELPQAPPAQAAAPAQAMAAAPVLQRGTRVLYVDDNPGNLKLMTELLAHRPGLEVLTAPTASLGLDIAQAHPPQLILLDLQLPGIDGYAALRLLRRHPRLQHVPVVAVTSLAYPKDVERGLAMGFADYITKPIDVNRLLAAVDRLVAAPPDAAGPT